MPQDYSQPTKGNDKYIIFRRYTPHGIFGIYGSGISYGVKHVDTGCDSLKDWIKHIKDGKPGRKRILKIINASKERALFADELNFLDSYTIGLTRELAGKNMPVFRLRKHDRRLIADTRRGLRKIRKGYST